MSSMRMSGSIVISNSMISSSSTTSMSSSSSSSRMSGLVGTLYCNDTQCNKRKLNIYVCLF